MCRAVMLVPGPAVALVAALAERARTARPCTVSPPSSNMTRRPSPNLTALAERDGCDRPHRTCAEHTGPGRTRRISRPRLPSPNISLRPSRPTTLALFYRHRQSALAPFHLHRPTRSCPLLSESNRMGSRSGNNAGWTDVRAAGISVKLGRASRTDGHIGRWRPVPARSARVAKFGDGGQLGRLVR